MSYLVGEQVHDDHSAVGLGVGLNIMLRLGTMMKTDMGMVLNTMMRLGIYGKVYDIMKLDIGGWCFTP